MCDSWLEDFGAFIEDVRSEEFEDVDILGEEHTILDEED